MEIVFLGTGGGRFVMVSQKRATGGIRINTERVNIHLDPGPGALVRSLQNRQAPWNVNVLCISHRHTDHTTDADVFIEAMTGGGNRKKGVLIAPASVLGGDNQYPTVTDYHQNLVKEKIICKPGQEIKLEGGKIVVTKTKHTDPEGVGFLFNFGKFVLSYPGDTGFTEEVAGMHKSADLMILNVIAPHEELLENLMSVAGAIEFLKVSKPKKCIITHFGRRMLESGPELQAKRIEKETGVQTEAAKDFMKVNIDMAQKTLG